MAISLVALVALAFYNFLVSVIQGVAGVGDAIFLQVLWSLSCELLPSQFSTTPLGTEPVRAVAILMYVRLLFVAPLIVYLGYHDSIFSLTMTVAMAVPSTVLSIAGVYLFAYLNADVLRLILGVSSLLFAFAYVCILLVRHMRRRRRLAALQEHHVKVVAEADALAEELHHSRNASIDDLHASFVHHVPNNSLFNVPAALTTSSSGDGGGEGGEGGGGGGGGAAFSPLGGWSPPSLTADVSAMSSSFAQQQQQQHVGVPRLSMSFIGVHAATRPPATALHPDTGLPPDVHEAYVSTVTGDIFTAAEAAAVPLNESNVPPLTTSKLSPSRTLTHTRVRVNRNLDERGKIRLRTKVGASVAASVAGLMASLTGVNAPPQIIFLLLYDAPNYIVRVNFCAQSIPGSLVRFAMALGRNIFTLQQAPMIAVTVVFGAAGVFAGNRIGRLLGPRSFNLFVLCILLLSALVMLTHSAALLLACMLVALVATVAAAWHEHTTTQPVIEAQRQVELEIERRVYDVMEQLRHSRVGDNGSGVFANFSRAHSFAELNASFAAAAAAAAAHAQQQQQQQQQPPHVAVLTSSSMHEMTTSSQLPPHAQHMHDAPHHHHHAARATDVVVVVPSSSDTQVTDATAHARIHDDVHGADNSSNNNNNDDDDGTDKHAMTAVAATAVVEGGSSNSTTDDATDESQSTYNKDSSTSNNNNTDRKANEAERDGAHDTTRLHTVVAATTMHHTREDDGSSTDNNEVNDNSCNRAH